VVMPLVAVAVAMAVMMVMAPVVVMVVLGQLRAGRLPARRTKR